MYFKFHLFQFCLALRYFATGGNYSLIGDSQHVSKALVSRCVRDVSQFFYRTQRKYIKWPASFEEKTECATYFFKARRRTDENQVRPPMQKTPNIIGMVDGTHVAIKCPKQNEACYVNRNSYHSINVTVRFLFSI